MQIDLVNMQIIFIYLIYMKNVSADFIIMHIIEINM